MLLFLHMNKHLWDVHDVHACFKREEAPVVAEVHDSSGGGATSSSPSLSSASISGKSNAWRIEDSNRWTSK